MNARRPLVALACVLLVVSAGCAGLTGPGGPTDTTTAPTPTTGDDATTTTQSTTDAPEQLAPGVTSEGVQDAVVLADAHLDAVRNHSFVKHERFERTNESGTAFRDATFQYASESRWRSTSTSDGRASVLAFGDGTFDRYADGNHVLWQFANETDRRYGFHSTRAEGEVVPEPGEYVFEESTYERSLVYSLASRADSVEPREGGGAVLSGTTDEFSLAVEPAANAEFTLTVSGDGLAESIDLSYEHAGESRDATYERSITFDTAVSEPVEQPDWYATALAETGAASAAYDDLLAPGVTTDGVQDAELLADAHLANVENETFRSRNTIRRTNASGTAYRNATFSMVTESEWRYTRSQDDGFPSTYLGPRFDAYADGERMLYQLKNETVVRYGVYQHHTDNGTTVEPADEVFEASYRQHYQRGFVYSLASRADQVTAVGNDAVRLTGTANDLDLGSPEVTNVSFSLTMAADGLAERIHLTYDHANKSATFEQTITFATNVTDPVERPDWYATALAETGAASAAYDDLLAPGVTTDGVQDAELLADAHLANIENETFVTSNRLRQRNVSEPRYQNVTFSMVDTSTWRVDKTATDPPVTPAVPSTNVSRYADGERVLVREDNGSAVTYAMRGVQRGNESYAYPPQQVFENEQYRAFYERGLVYSLASRAETVTAVGNDTVRLTGTADDLVLPVPATNISFSMTVAADGLAERIHLTYDHANEPATFERTITFTTNVTDPVERPDWYATALNETAANASA